MLLKKSTAALRPSSAVLSISTFRSPASTTPSRCTLSSRPARQRRLYASLHDGQPGQPHHTGKGKPGDELRWPTSAKPSPYEILGVARDAPYDKARFFRLAKLYHPDRQHQTADDGIPHLTKLERYRLVVVANEILSNPQKRRMYDLYGAGWDSKLGSRTLDGEAYRAWRKEPGNPSMNATWEDWERWRHARDGTGEKQEEVFTSNLAFLAIIGAFMIVGTWSQMTRAGTNSATFLEMRDQQHAAISRELQERRREKIGTAREARIESFLRQRELDQWAHDPPGHGLPALPAPGHHKEGR